MHADAISLSEVGVRLRQERDRRDLNQADFGLLGGINRNTQALYESGKRPFDVQYLLNLIENGVDSHFVLTGKREIVSLSEKQSHILGAFDAMSPSDQDAILCIASSLAGQPAPINDIKLPSTAALEDALAGFLEGSPGLKEDELVRELAMSLPTILRAAADEIDSPRSDRGDDAPAPPAAARVDRREVQQGQRI